jgi:hypothetical protein
MRRKMTLMIATAIVVSAIGAGPAYAGTAQQCQRADDNQSVGCCYKKSDTKRELNKCLKANTN